MIHIVFLCAVFANGIGCLPFTGMEVCRAAEAEMPAAIVESNKCVTAELRASYTYAPERSPIPPVKPVRRGRPV